VRTLDPADPRWIGTGDRRYRVLARIGSGGMGVVYFGRSTGGRSVTIKRVHAEFAKDREFRRRFGREVAAARKVGGGFTAQVIDADADAGIPYLVTEFLPALPVSEAVHEFGPLPIASVWTLAAGVAEALVSIHRAGVVHRDLKPSNVLLTADGPRVIDFGIAHLADAVPLTRPGIRVGSPGFMSPEQVAGGPVGPAGDIFSFGAMLVYACTGAEAFGEGSPDEKMARIEHGSPRLDGIADEALRELLESCMDRSPSRRPTAERLAEITASATEDGRSAGAWLPSAVASAIVAREREAENPPATPDRPADGPRRWWRGRRVVLSAAFGGALAIGVGTSATAWYGTGSKPAVALTPTATASPTAATPTVARPRTLEFNLTGNVTVTSLRYEVNGRTTTLGHVKLPWRKDVSIPPLPKKSTWRLSYRFPPGKVWYRVLVDGFEVWSGGGLSTGAPYNGNGHGTV
jgi:hypothetical protein